MADPAPKPKPSKGGLGKKVGPLPAWAWGLILVAVLGYFMFFRRGNSGTNAGAVSTDAAGSQQTPLDANAGAVNAAQAGQPSTNSAPADMLDPSTQGYLLTTPSALSDALTSALGNAYVNGVGPYATATGTAYDPGMQPADSVSTPVAAAPHAKKPSGSGGSKPKSLQPFGGIVHKRRLKNGATLTTYANGRQVEHRKGHKPYVVAKGR